MIYGLTPIAAATTTPYVPSTPGDTDWVDFGSSGSFASGGTVDWSNTGNALVDDISSATASLDSATDPTSYMLRVYNASLTGLIPAGAAIAGFEVRTIRRYSYSVPTPTMAFSDVRLLQGTDLIGTGKTGTTFVLSFDEEILGGAADVWGTSLSRADVVDSGFGVGLQVTCTSGESKALVFYVQIKVHYLT